MASTPADDATPARPGLDVRPFRALVYRDQEPGQLARVTSPAYDLVTAAGRDRLAASDAHNIVRLILPRVEGAEPQSTQQGAGVARGAHATDSSAHAARTLREWRDDGVLTRCRTAGLWRYEMGAPGSEATTGWLGAVGLPSRGSDVVLPHEDTYAPAVEGRRALLAATGTDLEPIVLAHDADGELAELTRVTGEQEPVMQVSDPDGVVHRLWPVTDRPTVARISAALGRTRAVIADGHHRFAAAQLHSRSGAAGSGAVLSLLTPTGTGGLQVRAIHRVVPDLGLRAAAAAAGAGFSVLELPRPGNLLDVVAAWLDDPAGRGFLVTDGVELVAIDHPTTDTLAAVPGEAPAAWRGLDVVLAHHGLISRLWRRADDPTSVLIAHDVPEAVRLAQDRHGVALLLRSPSPARVAAVARAGARMPRKSTLFVPKPRTGLVLRPHDD